MVPIPSGITAGPCSSRSNVPAEQALPQPYLCVCALQCCSGVTAGHTALLSAFTCVHRATLASAMLQLLTRCYLSLHRSLQSQPTSCKHSFYLPPQPRTGGGAEFSLDFFSFWGWNGIVRESISATLKWLAMSGQYRHCPCIPCLCLQQTALSGETWNQCLQDTANMCITLLSNEKMSYLEWTWACIHPTHCSPSPQLQLQAK